jgi:hypothetical protein
MDVFGARRSHTGMIRLAVKNQDRQRTKSHEDGSSEHGRRGQPESQSPRVQESKSPRTQEPRGQASAGIKPREIWPVLEHDMELRERVGHAGEPDGPPLY